jgi:hypothetical protein
MVEKPEGGKAAAGEGDRVIYYEELCALPGWVTTFWWLAALNCSSGQRLGRLEDQRLSEERSGGGGEAYKDPGLLN